MRHILYFTASWCNPCRSVKPLAEELISEGFDIRIIDVDSSDIVKDFDIRSVPTFVLIDNGLEIDRTTGAKTKEQLLNFIRG